MHGYKAFGGHLHERRNAYVSNVHQQSMTSVNLTNPHTRAYLPSACARIGTASDNICPMFPRLPAQPIRVAAQDSAASATWIMSSYLSALAPSTWLEGRAKLVPQSFCGKKEGSNLNLLAYLKNTSYAIG